MTNEEIMNLLKKHEERKASCKPFTEKEYAEFCAYLAEREAMDADGYFPI